MVSWPEVQETKIHPQYMKWTMRKGFVPWKQTFQEYHNVNFVKQKKNHLEMPIIYAWNQNEALMWVGFLNLFLCAYETWALRAELNWEIQALEMINCTVILGIFNIDRIPNNAILAPSRQEIRPHI